MENKYSQRRIMYLMLTKITIKAGQIPRYCVTVIVFNPSVFIGIL